ncbi:MAG TPA: zinc-binding dehydrogenase [Acidimicrobiia bacterium]|nr:zinc-binding dehydrogenase [Acidimicrobiia bacterium]
MKGLVYTGQRAELREGLDVRDPGPTEVKVQIVAAGLCHSDLSVINGTIPWPAPAVLGHEGAGIVASVGDAVTNVEPGDHVVLHTLAYCGTCRYCITGKPAYCRQSMGNRTQPFTLDGEPTWNFAAASFFTEFTIVDGRQCVKIPDDVPLESAALVGCGVLTGAGAVWNRADLKRGDTAVVFGVGGVGLNAIQAARIAGASRIIAVDTLPDKEKLARDFGATDFVLAGPDVDSVEAVHALLPFRDDEVRGPFGAGGADWVFDCVGAPATIRQGLDMLDWGGNVVIVGVPAPTAEFTAPVTYMTHVERGVMGCRAGSHRPHHDVALIIDMYRRGVFKLDELVTAQYPIEDWEHAVEDLEAGKLARGVLTLR